MDPIWKKKQKWPGTSYQSPLIYLNFDVVTVVSKLFKNLHLLKAYMRSKNYLIFQLPLWMDKVGEEEELQKLEYLSNEKGF